MLARNVASIKTPPTVTEEEVEILTKEQIPVVIEKLADHHLYDIMVVVDLNTGLRRGELLALRMSDVDFDKAELQVSRSLEETKAGLRVKKTKTKQNRTIDLPPNAIAVLRERRRKVLEMRMALGLGKPNADTLLFAEPDGSPTPPRRLTTRWREACVSLDLPRVNFHALRHTHASMLIHRGVNVVKISQRLGHKNPTVTLNIYAHLFDKNDKGAVDATEAAMTRKPEPTSL